MDAKEFVEDETFLEYEPSSSFWHHIRFNTPENTWEEFESSVNSQGIKMSVIWYVLGGASTMKGFKFETSGDKLKFIFKYSS